jgi:hypothetical protein
MLPVTKVDDRAVTTACIAGLSQEGSPLRFSARRAGQAALLRTYALGYFLVEGTRTGPEVGVGVEEPLITTLSSMGSTTQ